jgi:hypothetical protein
MTTPWPARFSDAHGVELTSIQIDHESVLRTRIRGFEFVGQPDALEPVRPLPPDSPFTSDERGDICGYTLEWLVPVSVDGAAGSPREGLLHLRLNEADGAVAAVLQVDGAEYRSRWVQYGLDEALMDVREQLPKGMRLRMCHSCGLAEYPDDAYLPFGGLICFRNTPDEIRRHSGRLGTLWLRRAGFVAETHSCSQFEPGGYRGTVERNEPNTWAVEDWDKSAQ